MNKEIPPRSYPASLAIVWALGLAGAFAWQPLRVILDAIPSDEFGIWLAYVTLLALAPAPAVAAATLLVRDFGWRRGLAGAPAAVLAVALNGVWHVALALVETGAGR